LAGRDGATDKWVAMSEPVSPKLDNGPDLAPGTHVTDRFIIGEAFPNSAGRRRYRAEDKQDNSKPWVLTQVGRPSKETEPDKVKRGIERTTRATSWIQHPGIVVPKDFFYVEGILYSAAPERQGIALKQWIAENSPAITQLIAWIAELANMMEQLHESRQPQFVGRLSLENLQIGHDGILQLRGFDLSPDLKLAFFPENAASAAAPDAKFDARSDVWCLGTLLTQLIEISGDGVKKALRDSAELRSLISQCVDPNPDKRPATMAALKTRLERLKWKDAPKPRTTSITETPIHILTVVDKSPFVQLWQRQKIPIMLAVAGFLAFMAILVNLFPPDFSQ
jgi:hypothetical protein